MSTLAIIALSVAYAFAGLFAGCRVATLLAWEWCENYNARSYVRVPQPHPNGEQWFGAGCVGLLAAAVWPLVVVAASACDVLFAPPHDVQLRRQKARVAELERELQMSDRGGG